jgi:uncharacterized membrane protein (DUF2068 family)
MAETLLHPEDVFIPKRARALKAIIAYKLGRAGLSFVGSVVGLVLGLTGLAGPLQDWAAAVHDHAVSALALDLTRLLASAVEPKHIVVVAGALAVDAVVLLVEGWALHRGYTWAVWLVVGASAVLLPFEVVALVQKLSAGRVLILVINAAIATWLLLHAIRKHRART